jgi:1-acyl-sn-glycerol-3-phosphate acyltransferase
MDDMRRDTQVPPTTVEPAADVPVMHVRTSDWWFAALVHDQRLTLRRMRAWLTTRTPSVAIRDQPFGPFYGLSRMLVTPLYHLLWRVRVEGRKELPRTGPAIIAANHVSFFDSVVLVMSVRRTLSFAGKVEYLESWKTRRMFAALGMIPVDRTGGRRALLALSLAGGILRAGRLFAIYPEGTRSRDGKLHSGHTGAAYLSLATGAPIVPAGIVGTNRIQPPGTRVPRPFRPVVIRFGAAIDPKTYVGGRRQCRRRLTDDVMTAIHALSGQEYSSAVGLLCPERQDFPAFVDP